MPLLLSKEALEEIGLHILNGMTEKEACTLSEVSWNDLQEQKEQSKITRDFIEKKHVEFKANHLKEIQKNKSEKNSMWLLEKLRPDEFGSKARGHEGPTINIISQIIKDIQNDEQGIVTISRGSRTPTPGEPDKNDSVPRLSPANILNG